MSYGAADNLKIFAVASGNKISSVVKGDLPIKFSVHQAATMDVIVVILYFLDNIFVK